MGLRIENTVTTKADASVVGSGIHAMCPSRRSRLPHTEDDDECCHDDENNPNDGAQDDR